MHACAYRVVYTRYIRGVSQIGPFNSIYMFAHERRGGWPSCLFWWLLQLSHPFFSPVQTFYGLIQGGISEQRDVVVRYRGLRPILGGSICWPNFQHDLNLFVNLHSFPKIDASAFRALERVHCQESGPQPASPSIAFKVLPGCSRDNPSVTLSQ